jgi:hypothetical protein
VIWVAILRFQAARIVGEGFCAARLQAMRKNLAK